MPRYTSDPDKLDQRLEHLAQSRQYAADTLAHRKDRDLERRRMRASIYAPRLCMGDPITGDACTKAAVPGATLCPDHGGTTRAMQQAAKMRLLALVEPALEVITKLLSSHDEQIRLRAALAIMDRSGFHPSATLEVKEQAADLSTMPDAVLRARAHRLLRAMDEAGSLQNDLEPEELPVIDVEQTDAS